MGNLRELARIAKTPGVSDVFSSTADKLTREVETKIKDGHARTQTAIDDAVKALGDATTNAMSLKQTADAADQTWFNCVRVEKSMLESVEHAEAALAKSRSAVAEPCQEQQDKAKFNWKAEEEDLAFECDISTHDNCDAQLASYKSQINSLFEELEEDVKEAGREYDEAKQRCDRAKQDVVRKQSALDAAKQTYAGQQRKCSNSHTQATDGMCTFGSALQNKCADLAEYRDLVEQINAVKGNHHSHPDRVEEWKVTHSTKCWLSKAAAGETLDEAAFTSCLNSANFDNDVGTLDLKSKTVASLTSSAKFSCEEETITFTGKQWKIPTGSDAKSTDYIVEDFSPAVTVQKGRRPFGFCGGGDGGDAGGDKGVAGVDEQPPTITYKSLPYNGPRLVVGKADEFVARIRSAQTKPGYCTTPLDTLTYRNTQTCPRGSRNNIGFDIVIEFEERAKEGSTWHFDFGVDFGLGGAIFVDGQKVKSYPGDIWWAHNENHANHLGFKYDFPQGRHQLELIGAEACCDGPSRVKFCSNCQTETDMQVVSLEALQESSR